MIYLELPFLISSILQVTIMKTVRFQAICKFKIKFKVLVTKKMCFFTYFYQLAMDLYILFHFWKILINCLASRYWHLTSRSSRLQMPFKIGVLKNLGIFTGKHVCWGLFLVKLQALDNIVTNLSKICFG